jgi:protein-S-isoprenylcysteine O-methyltransferase Ste14
VTSLLLRTAVFAVLMPALVVAYVPWLIVSATGATLAASAAGLAGIVLAGAGLSVLLVCFLGFIVEGRGTPAPYDPPRRLVTGALYARVRNPMYLAVTTILAGEAILFSSAALAVWAAVAWLVFHAFVVGYEEPGLRGRFGAAYEEYLRRVPRWIPRA